MTGVADAADPSHGMASMTTGRLRYSMGGMSGGSFQLVGLRSRTGVGPRGSEIRPHLTVDAGGLTSGDAVPARVRGQHSDGQLQGVHLGPGVFPVPEVPADRLRVLASQ